MCEKYATDIALSFSLKLSTSLILLTPSSSSSSSPPPSFSSAFDLPRPDGSGKVCGDFDEMTVVEAREIMYDLSQKMHKKEFLDEVEKECGSILPTEVNKIHTKVSSGEEQAKS